MPHEPFPVADFKQALYLPKEPWLSPKNAFRKVNNANVFRGQLKSRSGFSRFAEPTADLTDVSVAGVANSALGGQWAGTGTIYQPTVLSDRPVPESVSFSWGNNGGITIYADIDASTEAWRESGEAEAGLPEANDIWWYHVYERGTSNSIGWAAYLTDHLTIGFYAKIGWSSHSGYTAADPPLGTLDYRLNSENDITGLVRFQDSQSVNALVMDSDNVYLYNNTTKIYDVQGKASAYNYFTGSGSDFFWTWPTDTFVVMTNGIDPVHRWTPGTAATSVTEMPTDWAGAGNELLRCLLVIVFRGRLLYLNVTEATGGTKYPTRVRFTAAGTFTGWNSPLDYTDGPHDLGDIVTAQFIGERLFVGFELGWMELVSTGDAILPLDWRPSVSRFGAVSKLSTLTDKERLLSRSKTTMQQVTPNGQQYLDQSIPDLVLDFDPDKVDQCVSVRNEEQRGMWWTYVKAGGTRPNNILCATYDEEGELSWSQHDLRFNVFSSFDSNQSPTWNNMGPKTWNELAGTTWNSASVGAEGFTQILGGGEAGIVYVFDNSNRDEYAAGVEPIEMDIHSQAWAPYPGQQAHWGWLDIFADASDSLILTLEFFANRQSSAYKTSTVDLTPAVGGSKVWRRIPVDRTATFHEIRVTASNNKPVGIDAFIPWFRAAGRTKGFN